MLEIIMALLFGVGGLPEGDVPPPTNQILICQNMPTDEGVLTEDRCHPPRGTDPRFW